MRYLSCSCCDHKRRAGDHTVYRQVYGCLSIPNKLSAKRISNREQQQHHEQELTNFSAKLNDIVLSSIHDSQVPDRAASQLLLATQMSKQTRPPVMQNLQLLALLLFNHVVASNQSQHQPGLDDTRRNIGEQLSS